MDRFEAALQGAQEVGFTVLSISISLIAVFIPILLMGGIYRPPVPRVRDHAVGRGADLAGDLADHHADDGAPTWSASRSRTAERSWFGALRRRQLRRRCAAATSGRSTWRWTPGPVILVLLVATIALNVYLYAIVPKGFFPEQDTGQMIGGLQADQSSSFQITQQRLRQFVQHHRRATRPCRRWSAFVGGGRGAAAASCSPSLKPKSQRKAQRRAGDRARCGRSWRGSPAPACSWPRCRTCASAGGSPTPPTSTRWRPTTWPTCAPGRPS